MYLAEKYQYPNFHFWKNLESSYFAIDFALRWDEYLVFPSELNIHSFLYTHLLIKSISSDD